jgi:hypothetical protein
LEDQIETTEEVDVMRVRALGVVLVQVIPIKEDLEEVNKIRNPDEEIVEV